MSVHMNIQKVYKNGNSLSVTLPSDIAKEIGIRNGSEVVVSRQGDSISFSSKQVSKQSTRKEFRKWLKGVLKEDGEILDELANR